jgi:uncharacterized iron-regulated protein
MGEWIAGGGVVSAAAALDRLAAARVALLGESHDCAEDHAWQERLVGAVVDRSGPITVGFEMFPRAAQQVLDAWSAGVLGLEDFLEAVRWREVWGFDPKLYRGLLLVCRDRGLPMLALNVDRPVVSAVGRDGWDALPPEDRGWLTPAAPASRAYRRYLFAVTGGVRPGRAAQAPDDPAFDRFVRAQQVWDRAFACAIAGHLAGRPAARVIGIVGRGHLEYGYGTPFQLKDLAVASVLTALRGEAPAGDRPPIADLVWTGECARG